MSEDPILTFACAECFDAWLVKHGAKKTGVWLRIAKAKSGQTSVSYAEAIDIALCHGWIDGQKKPLDEAWWLQRFSPRSARSIWSKINREKVQRLVEAGRMKPAGQAEIDRAKADGRWEAAYDGASTMAVPDDLLKALGANPPAAAFFEKLDSTNRYAILFRLHHAKRAETRARRLAQFVDMLARGEVLHERKKPG
jgi:uncharacterized protein YdeI (YjbR/CyaY-like superfamily)